MPCEWFSVESTTPGRYVQFIVSFGETKGIRASFFERGRFASVSVGLSPDQWSATEFLAWRRVRAHLPKDFCFMERLRSEILLPV